MTIPTSPTLRLVGALQDRIGNFGSFPPTEKLRDRWGIKTLFLNHADPLATHDQMLGIESHGVLACSWEPVPLDLVNFNGVEAARRISVRVGQLGSRAVGLNLEGLNLRQIREFLWGSTGNGIPLKGWRGSGGVIGSETGWRPGLASYWIDEPFKDGTVKPHVDLKLARMMHAAEGFDGPMNQIDHPRAILDRIVGYRNGSGDSLGGEAYPPAQVVGCYDAALGIRIRSGLYFTVERFPGIFTARRRLLNAVKRTDIHPSVALRAAAHA